MANIFIQIYPNLYLQFRKRFPSIQSNWMLNNISSLGTMEDEYLFFYKNIKGFLNKLTFFKRRDHRGFRKDRKGLKNSTLTLRTLRLLCALCVKKSLFQHPQAKGQARNLIV